MFTPCQIFIAFHEVFIEICNGNHVCHVPILHFGYLLPENVEQLFSLSSSQLACMPGHLDTLMHHIYLEHMCRACKHMLHMPDMMSLGSHMM